MTFHIPTGRWMRRLPALLLVALALLAGLSARAETQEVLYADGTLKARVNLREAEDGRQVRHGGFLRNHPNGRPAVEGRYLNGRPVGIWSWWDDEGHLLRQIRKDGQFEEQLFGEDIHDPNTVYVNTAKQRVAQGILKFDKGHGRWSYWFPDGMLKAQGNFLGGIPEGRWVTYYEDGQIRGIDEYQLGLPHGLYMRAYPSGQEQVRGRMDHGLRVGTWDFWYANGQKKAEGGYDNDREEGEWRYWDRDGKLTKRVRFHDGKAVATLPLPHAPKRPPSVIPRKLRDSLEPPLLFDEDGREILRQD